MINHNNFKKLQILFLLFTLFLCFEIRVHAQPSITDPGDFNSAPGGQSLEKILTSGESCSWDITPTNTGFQLNVINSTQAKIIYRPPAGTSGCIVRCTLQLSNANGSSPPYYLKGCIDESLPQNEPVDIVMVIDKSGSMGDPADCNGAPASMSKMEYLRAKVLTLFNSMQGSFSSSTLDHKFGLVSFSNNAQPEIAMTLFNDSGLSGNFSTKINGILPDGSTSMGAGIREAISMLGGTNPLPTRTRVIMLLTNGIQNTAPMVEDDGTNIRIGSPANIVLTNSDIEIIPYAIFTPDGAYMDLLNRLTALNGTSAWEITTTPRVCDVTSNLQTDWVQAASATGSPKTVAFKSGILAGLTGTETFNVTENMDQLTLYVSSVGTHDYTNIKVEKKSGATFTDITALGNIIPPMTTPSKHRVFTVTFPTASIPSAMGEYRFSFTATQPNLSYDASAIVDDRGLKQAFHIMPIIAAGEKMFLGTQLKQSNLPVTDATVRAIIYAPKKRLNESFASKSVPSQFIKVSGPWRTQREDGKVVVLSDRDGYIKNISINHPTLPSFLKEGNRMKIGEKKYLILLNETNFEEVYDREIVATVPLKHEGNGIYRAIYGGTKKTGLYYVRMEAEGTHPIIGAYKRFEEKTPLVRFGTPDTKRSCLFVLYENPLIIMMKPIDIEGNLLGPNQTSAIKVRVNGGSASDLTDYLDGRYVFTLYPSSANDDPTISITIHDRFLYRGPLSGLTHKRWYFSLNGGFAQSDGSGWSNGYKDGYFGEGRLGVRIYKKIGLQLKAAYYTFPNNIENQANYNIGSVGLGVTYRQWFNILTGFYGQGEIGLGMYKPKNLTWEQGLNAGVSLFKPLNHFINASIDVGYHNISATIPIKFWAIGLGLQVRFGSSKPSVSIK